MKVSILEFRFSGIKYFRDSLYSFQRTQSVQVNCFNKNLWASEFSYKKLASFEVVNLIEMQGGEKEDYEKYW